MAVFDITLFSQSLRRQTQVTAILPVEAPMIPGFAPPGDDKPFRSLFLLHGFTENHLSWIRSSKIEQIAIAHHIAVFCPSGENSFYLDDVKRDALYEQYVCHELVDFTRKVFPVSHERRDICVGGTSMGGYGALHSGLKHPEVFGSIIALSSALLTDNMTEIVKQKENPMATPDYYRHIFGDPETVKGGDTDPKALAKKIIDSGIAAPQLYMACGTEDFLINENRDLHAYLNTIGYDHQYAEGSGVHDFKYWDEHIDKGLSWFDSFYQ